MRFVESERKHDAPDANSEVYIMSFSIKNSLVLACSLFALISANAMAQQSSFLSTQGRVIIKQNGNSIAGTYEEDNGRIAGSINKNIFQGVWAEDGSNHRCSVEKLNSFYWGRVIMEFNSGGFNGKWSYCNDNPGAEWNGKLENGNVPFFSGVPIPQIQSGVIPPIYSTSVWNTSWGQMQGERKNDEFKAKYADDNGRIEGKVIGNKLNGYWGEDGSNVRCATQKMGTYFWGRMDIVFTEKGFSAKWGYCDDNPGSEWGGELVKTDILTNYGPNNTDKIQNYSNLFPPLNSHQVWSTSWGQMRGDRNGNNFAAKYDEDNGRISGTMSGSDLTGYWGEDGSNERCGYERMGTFYWGHMNISFNKNGFDAKWGYCDGPADRAWGGSLVSGN